MNALVTTAPAGLGYSEIERLAASIAKSGLFGMKTPDQAMALMMIAVAEGRHPALAARDYDVIQGRPAKKAEAMLRDFLSAGGKVQWTTLNDATADATFSHPQGGTVRIIWDIDRAALAGLSTKENWKKYPRQMLRSRVVSEGVRTVWPMATSGMYETGEAADMRPANDVEHSGPTLDSKAETPTGYGTQTIGPDTRIGGGRTRSTDAEAPLHGTEPVPAKGRTIQQFLDALALAVRDAKLEDNAAEAVDRIICRDDVMRVKQIATGDAAKTLTEILSDALAFIGNAATDELQVRNEQAELPPIVGEERVAAG
jgi:hypothetical protein